MRQCDGHKKAHRQGYRDETAPAVAHNQVSNVKANVQQFRMGEKRDLWTAPTPRQRGIGRLLAMEVLNWARSRNARILQLMVTSHNQPAICFYQRPGFARRGRTEPYPNDPAVIE